MGTDNSQRRENVCTTFKILEFSQMHTHKSFILNAIDFVFCLAADWKNKC